MTYVGGTRDRLVHDSLYHYVQGGLTALGWFNSNRQHVPLNVVPEQKSWEEPLEYNTITIAPAGVSDEQWELGSFGSKNTTTFYIDVYGENEALGLQISGDIRDLLRGKFTAIGAQYIGAELPVMDYTLATPAQIFYCDIENVRRDRAQNFPHHWQRYFYVVSLEVVDYYGSESTPEVYAVPGIDGGVPGTTFGLDGGTAASTYGTTELIDGGTPSPASAPSRSPCPRPPSAWKAPASTPSSATSPKSRISTTTCPRPTVTRRSSG